MPNSSTMDGRSNSDLNGIRFADTPWVIAPQPWIEFLPGMYQEYWPEERRLGRLHAMGYDAYHLVAPLFAMRGRQIGEIDGVSGRLYVDPDGRIHRRLAWGEFQSGEVVALPEPLGTGTPIDVYDESALPPLPDERDLDPASGPRTREL